MSKFVPLLIVLLLASLASADTTGGDSAKSSNVVNRSANRPNILYIISIITVCCPAKENIMALNFAFAATSRGARIRSGSQKSTQPMR